MITNFFPLIRSYKRIKNIRRLKGREGSWVLCKRWTRDDKGRLLTTIHLGTLENICFRRKQVFYRVHADDVFLFIDGSYHKPKAGYVGSATFSYPRPRNDNILFLWQPDFALLPNAERPLFNLRIALIVNRYFWK